MKALDLFCGGGGAALGMSWAGFDEIVGIDIKPHPNYPFNFIQADIHQLPVNPFDFDFVWASPPCQKFSIGTSSRSPNVRDKLPNLLPITRELLKGHPYSCIENVPQAPMRNDLTLWGQQVGLETLKRKRIFELSFWMWNLPKPNFKLGTYLTITSSMGSSGMFYRRKAEGKPGTLHPVEYKHAMGIPICAKMSRVEVGEAVAPPMAEYIAKHAIQQIRSEHENTENNGNL